MPPQGLDAFRYSYPDTECVECLCPFRYPLMFVLSFPYVCSINPYILMKNHGCEAYSSQLWHVFFTTVEKAYHSRAHMINPEASQDKPPCKTQQKPM